jgi:hypothetical protein
VLDLLQDVPDKATEAADLGQLCELLRQSTSSAIQSTAYRVLAKVIKTRTIALVVEVEGSVAEAEEGHVPKEIFLPAGLVDIVRAPVEWYSELAVSTALAHLLGWMAILDHFDDAVSKMIGAADVSLELCAGHILTRSTRPSSWRSL